MGGSPTVDGGHQPAMDRGSPGGHNISIMQQWEIRVSICLCTSMYRKSKSTELFKQHLSPASDRFCKQNGKTNNECGVSSQIWCGCHNMWGINLKILSSRNIAHPVNSTHKETIRMTDKLCASAHNKGSKNSKNTRQALSFFSCFFSDIYKWTG